jgi:metal-responsive CopG/Arc/MetJ family transcriptional regulator
MIARGERLASPGRSSYTPGMKTAISLPDALFQAGERHARRTGKSRSQLYADALAEYLHRRTPEEVTETMNRVMERLNDPSPDPWVQAAARQVLETTEW